MSRELSPSDGGVVEPDLPSAAEDFVALVTERSAAFSRKAADDLYAHLLEATQDYLIENARFNIGSTMDGLKRQARHDREAWGKAEARAASLTDALKRLWTTTTCGADYERLAALSAAGDLLARIGALAPSPHATSGEEVMGSSAAESGGSPSATAKSDARNHSGGGS